MPRRTKIVTTLGPATDREGILEGIIRAGADMVRMNFSHGTAEDHILRANQVRDIAAKLGRHVAIMGDLQGPKIRVSTFKDGKIYLAVGDKFILDAALGKGEGCQEQVGIDYKSLPGDVIAGDILLLDDGRVQLKVEQVEGTRIHTTVTVAGPLSNNKGINKKGGGLSAPALTEKDKEDIKTAARMNVDYLAVSFPRCGDDLRYARELAKRNGATLIAVTSFRNTPLRQMADMVLDTVADENELRISSISSRTAQNTITDILFLGLVQRRDEAWALIDGTRGAIDRLNKE